MSRREERNAKIRDKVIADYDKQEKKKKKKPKTFLQKLIKALIIIIVIILVILIGSACAGYFYLKNMLSKIQVVEIDQNAIGIEIDREKQLKGYRNVALFGIDSRSVGDYSNNGNRSDCIMIASINLDTGSIKLVSVYRDTYLQVNENGYNRLDKITHAFSYGGAQNSLLALNTNLGFNIKEYVTVDFNAVATAVDAIGGVDIEVTKEEIKYVNSYIQEVMNVTGKKSSHITQPGLQHLDGCQAVGWARIRYTAGGDYKRTERMRTVIMAMVDKAKTLSVTKLISAANQVLPLISTNIPSDDIISLIPTLINANVSDSIGWPYTVSGATIDGVWYGVPCSLESNLSKLYSEVFEDQELEVSDKIKAISKQIINKTGRTANSGAQTNDPNSIVSSKTNSVDETTTNSVGNTTNATN